MCKVSDISESNNQKSLKCPCKIRKKAKNKKGKKRLANSFRRNFPSLRILRKMYET